MNNRTKQIIVLLAVVILSMFSEHYVLSQVNSQPEAMELFSQANKTYQDAEVSKDIKEKQTLFQKSAEMYNQIIKSGFTSGPLYYNLANTYLRLGLKGKAILNYLKAQKLMPRNEDLKGNLAYAREHLQITEDGFPETLKSMLFFHFGTTINEETGMLIGFYLICIAFIILRIFWRARALKWVYIITGIITICLAVSVSMRIYENQTIQRGVVIVKSQVRSAPSADLPAIIEIPEGTDVIIQEEKEGWSKIYISPERTSVPSRASTAQGQKGWIPKSDIEDI